MVGPRPHSQQRDGVRPASKWQGPAHSPEDRVLRERGQNTGDPRPPLGRGSGTKGPSARFLEGPEVPWEERPVAQQSRG